MSIVAVTFAGCGVKRWSESESSLFFGASQALRRCDNLGESRCDPTQRSRTLQLASHDVYCLRRKVKLIYLDIIGLN